MISIYTEVEFSVSNFDDFDTETTRVIDEFFDLGPAIGRGSVSKKRGRPMLKVA